jgi:hypothetical protein
MNQRPFFFIPKNKAYSLNLNSTQVFYPVFSEVALCIKKLNKEIKKILIKLLAKPATVTFQKCDTEPVEEKNDKVKEGRTGSTLAHTEQ